MYQGLHHLDSDFHFEREKEKERERERKREKEKERKRETLNYVLQMHLLFINDKCTERHSSGPFLTRPHLSA